MRKPTLLNQTKTNQAKPHPTHTSQTGTPHTNPTDLNQTKPDQTAPNQAKQDRTPKKIDSTSRFVPITLAQETMSTPPAHCWKFSEHKQEFDATVQ